MDLSTITFAILTRNEAPRIQKTLQSLPPGAAVLVLDAESDDGTVDIARAAGAAVEVRAWRDFVDARRYLLVRAQTEWVFMLDADETLDEAARTALIELDPVRDAYTVLRRNRFCGREIRFGPWAGEHVLRLVKKTEARVEGRNGGTLHEQLRVHGKTEQLQGSIDHDSYPTLQSYFKKFLRYTELEAREKRRVSALAVLFALSIATARVAFYLGARRAYRDGWRGIVVALGSAFYPVVVAFRAWRLRPQ